MKKKSFYFILALFFSGCFNLKTPLPEVSYYDLDIDPKIKSGCQSSFYVGIAEVRALAVYETMDIIFKENDGKIVKVPKMAWIDSPKNLFKKFLIKQFNAHCIKTSLPPFGGVKNDYLLKIELLNFEVMQDKAGDEFVQIGVFYEVLDLKDFKTLQSGVIVEKEKSQPGYIASFRNVMNEVTLEILRKLKK